MNVWQVFFGGSWMIEDAILALVILTLTLCFGIMGYLININIENCVGHITFCMQFSNG